VPPVAGRHPQTDEIEARRALPEEPLAGLAFKIVADPFVGKLTYVRVYSGVLKSGSYVYNSTKDKRERIGRLLRMHANRREDVDAIEAGDIAAVVGLRDTTTGDTLCDPAKPLILENIRFPEPVISVAIEPRTKADQDRMGNALQRLSEEDPTFRVRTDPDSGETLISGMGELHLEVIVDRMLREFKVNARVGRPQVAYRETITQHAKEEGRYVRQSGVAASTATSGSRSIRWSPARESNSRTRRSAALYPRSTSAPSKLEPAKPVRVELSPAIRWSTCGSRWWMARITRLTRRRWPSRSPARSA